MTDTSILSCWLFTKRSFLNNEQITSDTATYSIDTTVTFRSFANRLVNQSCVSTIINVSFFLNINNCRNVSKNGHDID